MAGISSSDEDSNSSDNNFVTEKISDCQNKENVGDNLNLVPAGTIVGANGNGVSVDRAEQEISDGLDQLSTRNHHHNEKEDSGDSESSEEQVRKKVRVGNHFQARIPKLVSLNADWPCANDELLWSPAAIEEQVVEDFLQRISSLTKLLLPMGTHLRDDEHALYVLQENSHDIETAFKIASEGLDVPKDEEKKLLVWSEEECRNFESGLLSFGKNFYLIQKYKLSNRKVGELVQFYYLWKKTERYDLLASRIRTGKKKYALNPGISDLVCRYLGRQGSSVNNFSSDVQLVFTDNKKDLVKNNSQY